MTQAWPPPREIWSLPTRHIGKQCLVFDKVESTNALALQAEPTQDGAALLAWQQSGGRGQYGRTWQAPAGSSVLLSVCLTPPPHVCRPALLTAWAAVAVCETIVELTAAQPWIKWPNDVYLDQKKVCGILIEQRGVQQGPLTAVGIGLNVLQPRSFFDEAGLPLGGSLLTQTGKTLVPAEVARNLLHRLDELYAELLEQHHERLQALWQMRLGLVGRHAQLMLANATQHGVLRDIAFDALVLETEHQGLTRIKPEAVRQISIDSEIRV